MRKGDFKGAYLLLEPLESSRAGDIHYDYVFGVAVVESNNTARGAIALERVLATDNKHKNAHAAIENAHAVICAAETAKIGVKRLTHQNTDAETKKATEAS